MSLFICISMVVATQSTQGILVYRLYHEVFVSLRFTHLYIIFQQKLKLNRYGEQCVCVCVHIHVTCTKCMPAAMHMIAIIYYYYSRKFSPISPLLLAKFLSVNILCCVNEYIEDMATFTALATIYSTEYFCNTKVAELGEFFI